MVYDTLQYLIFMKAFTGDGGVETWSFSPPAGWGYRQIAGTPQ